MSSNAGRSPQAAESAVILSTDPFLVREALMKSWIDVAGVFLLRGPILLCTITPSRLLPRAVKSKNLCLQLHLSLFNANAEMLIFVLYIIESRLFEWRFSGQRGWGSV